MARIPVSLKTRSASTQDTDTSLPLITISIVRTISFSIYTSTKRILNSAPDASPSPGAETDVAPWIDLKLNLFNKNTATDVAMTSLIAGGASGAVVCVGSAPFELVKVGCTPLPSGQILTARSGDNLNTKSIAIPTRSSLDLNLTKPQRHHQPFRNILPALQHRLSIIIPINKVERSS